MKTFAVAAMLACSLTIAGCNQLMPGRDDDTEEDDGDAGGANGFGGSAMGGDQTAQNGNSGPVIPKGDNAGPAGNASAQSPLYSWFVGQWTDDGNCQNAITMTPEGRFINADGSSGNWELNGERLTMSAPGGNSITVTLVRVDQNRLQLVYDDGRSGSSTRC